MKKRKKINKKEAIVSIFLIVLTLLMPIAFTALQPEVDLAKGEIKQNPVIDSLASVLASVLSKVIAFVDIVPSVMAQDLGCCEVMKNGAKCQISLESECNSPQQWHVNQTCDTICQIGCCIDSQGMCMKDVISTQCLVPPALKFIPNDPMCQQDPLCKYGCCTVGYQKIWETNKTCADVHHGVWDGSVPDELTCIGQAYEEQKGCCRSYAGCEYITGAECSNKGGTFFANSKCYQNVPGCEQCIGYGDPKCLEGFPDLYKTDKCGNVYIDEVNQSCGDGFCDPETNQCKSGNCTNVVDSGYLNDTGTYIFETPGRNGRNRASGESWCVYDTVEDLGNGTAPMGAYSVRRYCLYGKEYVEPCSHYRQTICLEFKGRCVASNSGASIQEQAECSKKTKNECSGNCVWQAAQLQAYCMPNLYQSCVNYTTQQDCESNSFCFWWTNLPVKKNGNVVDLSDKNWIAFNRVPDGEIQKQICLPRYPPALDDNNKDFVCSQGSFICTYSSAYFGTEQTNTECDDSEWYSTMAHRCRALGDCGTYKNYINKTVTGLKIGEAEDKPQDTSQLRVKREIPLPQDYQEFLDGLKISQQQNRYPFGRFLLGLGYVATLVGIYRWVAPGAWGEFARFLKAGWLGGKILTAAAGVTAILAGGMILVYARSLPVGPGKAALESLGWGLISGGGAPLLGASAATAGLIGLGVFVLVFGLFWLTYDKRFYFVQCNPSLPPVGGEDCHLCNEDQAKPCTKYRCESLGQACMFNDTITIGTKTFQLADAECMAAVNDGAAPWITNIEVKDLQGNSYRAEPSNTTGPTTININKNGEAIPDGTSVIIKIKLNEKALCMWDIESTPSMSEMDFPYQSTVLREELQQQFLVKQALPFIYVRCADVYGNANVAEYIFRFSTTTGPDLMPPVVLGTDRDYNKKFGYGTTELPLWIYVNEMAKCKWDKQDKDYASMSSPECTTELTQTGFKCNTTLTGLQSEPPGIANTFYIRCNDTSGNAMQQSYQLVLYPTLPLKITSIVPENGAYVKGCEISGVELEVETAEGAENGKAICYWQNGSIWQRFSVTNDVTHLTNLSAVSQTVNIKCVDSALNTAINSTSFTVEADETAPIITRIYKDGSDLVLRTDEDATCTYHYSFGHKVNDCSFSANDTMRARKFDATGTQEHRTAWDSEPWHVKCYDSCGNVGTCTVINPSDVE